MSKDVELTIERREWPTNITLVESSPYKHPIKAPTYNHELPNIEKIGKKGEPGVFYKRKFWFFNGHIVRPTTFIENGV